MASYLSTALSDVQMSPTPPSVYLFPRLPFELRLKIYNQMLTPRYIHYNPTFALHLTLDPQIPPLLHISQESRSFALEWYKLHTVGTRRIYLHPTLDVVLWIRCPGPSSSSRVFRADAQHLLQDIQTSPRDIPNFAISIKYWNRIVKKADYKELYERDRKSVV